jgi:hypothetical protein
MLHNVKSNNQVKECDKTARASEDGNLLTVEHKMT